MQGRQHAINSSIPIASERRWSCVGIGCMWIGDGGIVAIEFLTEAVAAATSVGKVRI